MEKSYLDKSNSSRIFIGLIALLAGILLLARQLGAPIPGWLFSWPVILIVLGLLIGLKHKFQNPGAFILLLIGIVFLLDKNGIFDFKIYIAPVILMIIGLSIILTPKRNTLFRRKNLRPANTYNFNDRDSSNFKADDSSNSAEAIPTPGQPGAGYTDEEYLDLNAVLGGIKKRVLSKNFKGGEIVTFMGGVEVNFLNSDLQHPVILEVNNIFGGTKLLVPSHWDIKNELTAVFGGVDDKRNFVNVELNPQKVIYLKGTCLFGGVEIANF